MCDVHQCTWAGETKKSLVDYMRDYTSHEREGEREGRRERVDARL